MIQWNIKYSHQDNLISKIENSIYANNNEPIDGPESDTVYSVAIDPVGYEKLTNEMYQKIAGIPTYNEKKELITSEELPTSYTIAFLGKLEIEENTELKAEIVIKRIK